MPRLAVIEPGNAKGKAKELFEGPLKGKQLNIFKGMANSPAALNAYLQIGGALKQGTLSDAQREVIALAWSERNKCDYCLAAHTVIGHGAGLTDDQIAGARKGSISDPELNALAIFTHTMKEKDGWVDDEDLTALRNAGFDDGHIVEIIGVIAQSTFTNYFNHVNQTEVDFPEPAAV